jgi:DNA-binding PucR family transcriptional regulator
MLTDAQPQVAASGDPQLREQLSNLQGLLMLSALMTEAGDENKILHLAVTSVPSFGRCRVAGVCLGERWWDGIATPLPDSQTCAKVRAQLSALGQNPGQISFPGQGWALALPLRSLGGHRGYLIAGASEQPPQSEEFLLWVLAQQTGVALANAQLHAKERATAEELRTANAALADTVRALESTTRIHERFTKIAVNGEGQEGIARAVHELTGYRVAVEDRYGNLRAWAGPNKPDPYPKDPPAKREQMLRRALREGRPIRESGRLLAVAHPGADTIGVLALIDPNSSTGDKEQIALEHGATVLAMELARLRSLAETELRLRRDLVEELLAGTDEESALARGQALGHDLERPHRVVVAEGRGRTRDENAFFHAVRRAARSTGLGSLLVARSGAIVVISESEITWETFRIAVLTELGGGKCCVGIGGRAQRPGELPRSYREAQLALRTQRATHSDDRAICYDDLGVYRILSEVGDTDAVQRYVQQWLGSLLDYDQRKRSDLVATLSKYLECGGSYEATAAALLVHRSTLKYRLQRIRDISGYRLTDPDTAFNLQLATRALHTQQTLLS